MVSSQSIDAALRQRSASYIEYADARAKGWTGAYVAKPVRLGTAAHYAAHYSKYLAPLLLEAFPLPTDTELKPPALRFLDLGAAPGGLCSMLSQSDKSHEWSGVAVTLDPATGGLPMQIPLDNTKIQLRYADIIQSESFRVAAVADEEEGSYDFVNLGIVLDAFVKNKRGGTGAMGFGDQLYHQLTVARRALRGDGKGAVMVALKTDFPSLSEVYPTLDRLLHCSSRSDGLRIIPTMYSRSNGKKQFYALIMNVTLTDDIAGDIRQIWAAGKQRYREMTTALYEAKMRRNAEQGVGEGSSEDCSHKRQRDDDHIQLATAVSTADQGAVALVDRVYASAGKGLDHFYDCVKEAVLEQSGQ